MIPKVTKTSAGRGLTSLASDVPGRGRTAVLIKGTFLGSVGWAVVTIVPTRAGARHHPIRVKPPDRTSAPIVVARAVDRAWLRRSRRHSGAARRPDRPTSASRTKARQRGAFMRGNCSRARVSHGRRTRIRSGERPQPRGSNARAQPRRRRTAASACGTSIRRERSRRAVTLVDRANHHSSGRCCATCAMSSLHGRVRRPSRSGLRRAPTPGSGWSRSSTWNLRGGR